MEEIYQRLHWSNPYALKMDEFRGAYLGHIEQAGGITVACYDFSECLKILMSEQDMNFEEAIEWMDFNVTSAYMGEHTPCFLYRSAGI